MLEHDRFNSFQVKLQAWVILRFVLRNLGGKLLHCEAII